MELSACNNFVSTIIPNTTRMFLDRRTGKRTDWSGTLFTIDFPEPDIWKIQEQTGCSSTTATTDLVTSIGSKNY